MGLHLKKSQKPFHYDRLFPCCVTGINVDAFLLDLGRVLELKAAVVASKVGSSKPVRTFSASDIADVAQVARRQLVLAINRVSSLTSDVSILPMHACFLLAEHKTRASPMPSRAVMRPHLKAALAAETLL
jgi:uncharacterized protein (DUF2342 family)